MKKVFYNSWVAKHFLPFAHTITITAFVLTKRESLSQRVVNHECTHARQWIELTVASGLLLFLAIVIFGISVWWMLLAGAVFYIWYLTEFAIRFLKIHHRREAYRAVSFEQEARHSEGDDNYLENAEYFSWIRFLF